MNKYVGVIFRSKNELKKEETFIVSQDLIKRGIVEKLYIKEKETGKFVELTDKITILQWLQCSNDNTLYDSDFNAIGLNDIPFDDYINIYNTKKGEIGEFIVDRYLTFNKKRCDLFLSMKTDDIDNKIYCEYFNRTSNELIYTERVLGLDRVIEDEELKAKIKDYFETYKKENL